MRSLKSAGKKTDRRNQSRPREALAALRRRRKFAVKCSAMPQNATDSAGKLSFGKASFIYALGGIVGTVWETLLNLFRGRGFVFCNGSILTPFNFVYGTGALVIILLLKNKKKLWQVFITGTLGGGAVEYALSFLEEAILGTRSWNYSGHFLNINGRTTVPYMIFWGLLCVLIIFVVYRPLDSLLESLPKQTMQRIAIVLAVWIALDFLVTVPALIRFSERAKGNTTPGAIGRLIDKIFDDAFMQRRFPAMKFKK